MRLLLPLLLAGLSNAASITLHSPRLSILHSDGSQLRSEPISLTTRPPPLNLTLSDTLKITFEVRDKESGKGVQPHQTFLRFYDEESGEEGIQPIRVSPTGKAKFSLDMAKPPPSLPPTSTAPLKVTLIIGSPSFSPFKVELFDLYVPPSLPPVEHPDEASFRPRPLLQHTFRPEQKMPFRPISALFSLLVLSPWLVLLGLWGIIRTPVPYLFSPRILPFVASLGAIEVFLFWYWVNLTIAQVLLYGPGLILVAVFTGRTALASISERRLSAKK